ncbi:DUF1963 domain-containing protein [Herbidospora mongoliensis]|uniref:DUF1963 domain-containing protein n=1 Tax=Herbidospora mongoliensis TaxID=688067 RepID=UPI000AE16157|nr:DUF1963 domain-containing protein [Herbidospora mongoliensis]
MTNWLTEYAKFVDANLPSVTAAKLIALARPTIRLAHAGEGDPVVGRLGGRALLPPDLELGPHQTLAVELDCAALAAYETNLDLPTAGTLVFLAVFEYDGDGAVVYLPAGTEVVARELPEEAPEIPLTAKMVATWPESCQPHLVEAFGGVKQTYEAVWHNDPFPDELHRFERTQEPWPTHRVGGYSVAFQSSIEEVGAQRAGLRWEDPGFIEEAKEWVTLLQIAEDEQARMLWGDGGYLIYGIRRDDLASRDFSRVYYYVQGH